MKEVLKSVAFIIALALIQLIFILIGTISYYPFYKQDNYFESETFNKVALISSIIYTIIMIIILRKKININKISIKQQMISVFIGITISIIMYLVTKTKTESNILIILETGLLAPILEEMMYRGIIYNNINMKRKDIVVTLLFALSHPTSRMIYALFLGTILMISLKKTNSLKAPILIHISSNITSLII